MQEAGGAQSTWGLGKKKVPKEAREIRREIDSVGQPGCGLQGKSKGWGHAANKSTAWQRQRGRWGLEEKGYVQKTQGKVKLSIGRIADKACHRRRGLVGEGGGAEKRLEPCEGKGK